MDLKTPFHDSTASSFTMDNLRPSASRKRSLEVVSPKRKTVILDKEPPVMRARAKSSIAELRSAPKRPPLPVMKLQPALSSSVSSIGDSRNPMLSPPKPAKLRRSTSLLTPAEASQTDRFIPSHRNSTSNKLTPQNEQPHPNASPQTHIKAQTSKIYQHHVAEACGLDVNSRILCYRPAPPERSKPLSVFSSVNQKSATKSGSLLRPSVASARAKKIPTAPERVLDAPNIVDDFYLNLVAWASSNLIAIGLEDTVYVWNASTGSVGLLCELGNSMLVTSLRWSEDGSYISVGKEDGTIEIWDIETNSRLRTLSHGTGSRVAAHCWSSHLLASGSREGTIYHSDVRVNDHLVSKLENTHVAEICGLEYRADSQQFCSGANDNLVAVWDARSTSEPIFKKTNHRAAVKAMAWCPFQNSLLATGGGTSDKTIHFWNTSTGARVNSIETESQISSLNWGYESKTGYEVVATHGYPSNSISLFNYPTLQKTGEITSAHDSRVLSGCMSPDGTTLATVAGDENLKFWPLFDLHKQKASEEPAELGHEKHMKRLMELR
ncbi:hypothetical protein FT663_04215 [Candidozyma haemuli var. vulneris]|uniref:CDC20/Fizzy WD40 domain-containing protein n=1 Tax=Candidozyma haemuli TaxID=45357 RepID=A0A2V1ARG4_9ASCO|nr:hypothetical protein CXQ85_004325 [[Candida] haemuloni]KAF3987988.1 hypothetical protein FT663_04215 [[Candida] haemuloni var. vulneris]KAF3991787.1 hypothetical protein FT662_01541 [[Candida] haemuloni var. vulneris]PVH20817.1 hypothetical protein CXQ85_004325 [[Candida] haemuloni]